MVSQYLTKPVRSLFKVCSELHPDYERPKDCYLCGHMPICRSEAHQVYRKTDCKNNRPEIFDRGSRSDYQVNQRDYRQFRT